MRGQLEQIDYTAFAANRAAIAHTLGGGHVPASKFQRLAVAAAQARAELDGLPEGPGRRALASLVDYTVNRHG